MEELKVLLADKSMTIVNPNGRPWSTAYHGTKITLEPFEETKVPYDAGAWLLTKAEASFSNLKVEARDAMQQYLEMSSKNNHAARMLAERMLGEDGQLEIKAWDYPPAVRVDGPNGKEGRKILKEAKKKFAMKNNDGLVKDTGDTVELLKPKEDWDRDTLRDYIDKHYGSWQPASKAPVLLQQALRLYELQKKTILDTGKTVKEV